MKFEKLFEAVTSAKTALDKAEKAPALINLGKLANAFDDALKAVKDTEDTVKALEAVTSAKSALIEAENSKEVTEAVNAVREAVRAVNTAEDALKDGLDNASQYEVTLFLVTTQGHALDKALSEAYAELRGNTSERGNQQFVQKLKEGVRFAVDCLHWGMTLNDLENMMD